MAKIVSIDYGGKRCGLAETDELQIIATPLETVPTMELDTYLERYIPKYGVTEIVVGQPFRMSGELSDIEKDIEKFLKRVKQKFPDIVIHRINEAFTSKLALDSMIQSGSKKKDRRNKGNIDKIAATLILQEFLENRRNKSTL